MWVSFHLLVDSKNLTFFFIYFTFHCWISRSETTSGSLCLLVPSTLCRDKAMFFLLCTSQAATRTLDFQNNWQFKPITHEAEESGELCVQLWWPCSASVGAGCAGELICDGQRGVTKEMFLVYWDKHLQSHSGAYTAGKWTCLVLRDPGIP